MRIKNLLFVLFILAILLACAEAKKKKHKKHGKKKHKPKKHGPGGKRPGPHDFVDDSESAPPDVGGHQGHDHKKHEKKKPHEKKLKPHERHTAKIKPAPKKPKPKRSDVKRFTDSLRRGKDLIPLERPNIDPAKFSGIKTTYKCIDRSRLCPKYSTQCRDTTIATYCKRTCGLCPDQLGCKDSQPKQFCFKAKQLGFCRSAEFKEFFAQNCKKTCHSCKTSKDMMLQCGNAPMRKNVGNAAFIIGGKAAPKSFWPWQAAIVWDDKFLCGGTLIDAYHVLTAAHCFNYRSKDVNRYEVILGEHNRNLFENTEQYMEVKEIKIHEKYSTDSDEYDIAIMKLSDPAVPSDHVIPACFPSHLAELAEGSKCYITGWGSTRLAGPKAPLLQQLEVPIAGLQTCQNRNQYNERVVTDDMVCAGLDDGYSFNSGCHGDSGGGLMCLTLSGKWTVYGVVSWGSPQCNGLERYTVFTKVSNFMDWIHENL